MSDSTNTEKAINTGMGIFTAMGIANLVISWKVMKKITFAVVKEYPAIRPYRIVVDVIAFWGTLNTISQAEKMTVNVVITHMLKKYAEERM